MSTFIRTKRSHFARDTRGNVAVLFGLMGLTMFLCIGLSIDLGRWLQAKQATVTAMDAAVLAGGRALQLNPGDTDGAMAVAQKYYSENIKTRLPVESDNVTFITTDGGKTIKAQGNAYLKTTIMALAGVDTMPIFDLSGAEYSAAKLAAGGNAEINIEISMMLDITGSMSGSKIKDMRDAAKDLVDIVVLNDQSKFTSKVALVPFSQAVNLGSTYFKDITNKDTNSALVKLDVPSAPVSPTFAALEFLRSLSFIETAYAKKKKKNYDGDNNNGGGSSQNYGPCAVDRTGPDALTDAVPAPGNYVQAYDIAKQNNYLTKDSACKPGSITILPLTNDKTALTAKIDSFVADGWTAGAVGTAFAWYMLSPAWADIWPDESTPASYTDTKTKKYAILMTDGEYNTWYNGNVYGTASEQAVTLCSNMKANGIKVYTVGFDLGGNQTAIDTLKSCATDSSYAYVATSGEQLKQAFRDIAVKLSNLYLSK